jgi:hypothetical protein
MPRISKSPFSPALPEFVKGQLWQIDERFVKIGHVGRLLVHHRILLDSFKRSFSRDSIIAIKELQQFLTKNKAVLIENP